MDCSLDSAILVTSQVVVGLSMMVGVMVSRVVLEVWNRVISLSNGLGWGDLSDEHAEALLPLTSNFVILGTPHSLSCSLYLPVMCTALHTQGTF